MQGRGSKKKTENFTRQIVQVTLYTQLIFIV